MANLFKGKEVNAAIIENCKGRVESLKQKGIIPTLAILRVGENENDLSYEKGASKKCFEIGIEIKNVVFPSDVDSDTFFKKLDELNNDDLIHGILMFRPLPKQLDNELARRSINPSKDVDGCTDSSLTGVFANQKIGFAPCTAEAVIAMLDHYNVQIEGKNIVVVGRSLVIGKPVSMLLTNRNATVTICHTRTKEMASITNKADIVVCSAGKAESFGKEYFKEGQTIIDVGINWSEEKGKIVGDVKFDEVEPLAENITPVPGGIGSVTSTILCRHVVEAAENNENK